MTTRTSPKTGTCAVAGHNDDGWLVSTQYGTVQARPGVGDDDEPGTVWVELVTVGQFEVHRVAYWGSLLVAPGGAHPRGTIRRDTRRSPLAANARMYADSPSSAARDAAYTTAQQVAALVRDLPDYTDKAAAARRRLAADRIPYLTRQLEDARQAALDAQQAAKDAQAALDAETAIADGQQPSGRWS